MPMGSLLSRFPQRWASQNLFKCPFLFFHLPSRFCPVFKNPLPIQDPRSRLFWDFDVSFCLFQKQMILGYSIPSSASEFSPSLWISLLRSLHKSALASNRARRKSEVGIRRGCSCPKNRCRGSY